MASEKVLCPYCNQDVAKAILELHKVRLCKNRPIGEEPPSEATAQETPASPESEPSPVAMGEQESPLPSSPPDDEVAPAPPSTNHRLDIPIPDENYLLPETIRLKMGRISKLSEKHPVNVLLLGPQGSGKTSLALQYAARNQKVCFVAPCVTMQEPQEWWGTRHFDPEKGTYYTPSLFVQAVRTPGAVVVLDDINRVENPKVLNPLFPLLDDRRKSWVEEMDTFLEVAPGVTFFATMNEGWEFQGTDPIDRALRDRFHQIRLGYPRQDIIVKILTAKVGIDRFRAIKLAGFAVSLAESQSSPISISLRQLLIVSEDIVAGGSMRDAVMFCVVPGLPEDSQESVLQALQQIMTQEELAATGEGEWEVWK